MDGFHWQSVESGSTGGGIPDSNYCCAGVEGWVEYKWTSGWTVGLRPAQVGWLSRRARAGGLVFVGVRRRNATCDQLWLLRGSAAALAKAQGLRALPDRYVLGRWDGGPGAWDWQAIRATLLDGPPG